jgi:hypothetical protein
MNPTQALAAYVLLAMTTWSPRAEPARLDSIAVDIATVSLEGEPVFPNDPHRAKEALLLASVARFESNYADWVDDGRCNDRAWLASAEGRHLHRGSDCDGGRAHGLWQVHLYTGMPSAEAMADRRTAARAARDLLRASLRRDGTLCAYTGEGGDCPKGNLRLRTALVWAAGHPWREAPEENFADGRE